MGCFQGRILAYGAALGVEWRRDAGGGRAGMAGARRGYHPRPPHPSLPPSDANVSLVLDVFRDGLKAQGKLP